MPQNALDRFMKVFVSLPLTERDQVAVVIEDNPISWNMAYREIRNNTQLGETIIKKLIALDVI